MRSRAITKQRVVKFCEGCAYILGQLFVTALGFAIYQAIKSFF